MLTEECELNHYLENLGYNVVDTDLGERITQLRQEVPSHIVAPAIHLKKEEISHLFHEKLQTGSKNYLAELARNYFRTLLPVGGL